MVVLARIVGAVVAVVVALVVLARIVGAVNWVAAPPQLDPKDDRAEQHPTPHEPNALQVLPLDAFAYVFASIPVEQ